MFLSEMTGRSFACLVASSLRCAAVSAKRKQGKALRRPVADPWLVLHLHRILQNTSVSEGPELYARRKPIVGLEGSLERHEAPIPVRRPRLLESGNADAFRNGSFPIGPCRVSSWRYIPIDGNREAPPGSVNASFAELSAPIGHLHCIRSVPVLTTVPSVTGDRGAVIVRLLFVFSLFRNTKEDESSSRGQS